MEAQTIGFLQDLPFLVDVFVVRLVLIGLSKKGFDFGRRVLASVGAGAHLAQQVEEHASRRPPPRIVDDHHSPLGLDLTGLLEEV